MNTKEFLKQAAGNVRKAFEAAIVSMGAAMQELAITLDTIAISMNIRPEALLEQAKPLFDIYAELATAAEISLSEVRKYPYVEARIAALEEQQSDIKKTILTAESDLQKFGDVDAILTQRGSAALTTYTPDELKVLKRVLKHLEIEKEHRDYYHNVLKTEIEKKQAPQAVATEQVVNDAVTTNAENNAGYFSWAYRYAKSAVVNSTAFVANQAFKGVEQVGNMLSLTSHGYMAPKITMAIAKVKAEKNVAETRKRAIEKQLLSLQEQKVALEAMPKVTERQPVFEKKTIDANKLATNNLLANEPKPIVEPVQNKQAAQVTPADDISRHSIDKSAAANVSANANTQKNNRLTRVVGVFIKWLAFVSPKQANTNLPMQREPINKADIIGLPVEDDEQYKQNSTANNDMNNKQPKINSNFGRRLKNITPILSAALKFPLQMKKGGEQPGMTDQIIANQAKDNKPQL